MTAPFRPFHELAPPPDGLAAVRRAARRRRTRSVLLTSATGLLVALGATVLLPHGQVRATDRLQVTDDPTPSSAPSPTTARRAAEAPVTPGPTTAAVAPSQGTPQTSSPAAPVFPARGPAPAYRTPDLLRAYVARPSSNGVTVCSGSASSTGTQLQQTVSWCLGASATSTARGHDLTGEVCRDSSSDAQLTFAAAQEVELAVQDAAGHVVWQWSRGHADPAQQHVLDVQREHCWTWTAPWTDVDATGSALPSGSYQLVVRSRAQELTTAPDATASFAV